MGCGDRTVVRLGELFTVAWNRDDNEVNIAQSS
jgi:hypothetical protein